ncbi:MBL fold metallo-hydrolase [Kibdelosporangium aridum]|uniref:MBL fold metallo-hydrolase n=1 Tax=Kibdelosporangium aridum TaxID=2030 RepID=UPI0035EAFC14
MVGPMELQAFAMHHSVPTFGVRAEANGRLLAYSADTGPCEALVELGQGTDVLVVEAGASEPVEFHCTPEEVAHATATSAPRQVVLTRLAPGLDGDGAITRFGAVNARAAAIASMGLRVEL